MHLVLMKCMLNADQAFTLSPVHLYYCTSNSFDVSVQDQVPRAAATVGATAAMAAMAMLPVEQATGATAAMATVLLLVLGLAVAATTAILPPQELGTQARTAVKAALSQAAMDKMVATAVPLAVSLLIVYMVGPCIKLTPQPLSPGI